MLIRTDEIEVFCQALHKSGAKIVFTNGCFDILHAGHVRYLKQAKTMGDYLIVGLNADEAVSRLKGQERPINGQEDRAEVLSALSSVDFVVVFEEDTAVDIVDKIKPDIYVKGGDYTLDTLPEATVVQRNGGQIIFVEVVEGRSTSRVVEKIKLNL